MNEGKRFLSVFISPGALFEDLKDSSRLRWWLPFIVTCVMISAAAVIHLMPMLNQMGGFEILLQEARAQRPDVDPAFMKTMFYIGPAISRFIVQAMVLFITGLGFWALFAVFGADINFKKSMAVSSFSGLIVGFGAVITSLVQLISNNVYINASLAFLPFLETGSYLFRLFFMIDFFALWHVIVMGFGYSIVAKKDKLTSYLIVAIAWLGFMLLAAALMGSSFRVSG